jgi:hypothetical protein
MADILEMGANWLSDQFKTHASREVTLRTPGGDLTVLATLGRTEVEEVSQSGVVVRIKVRDYLVETDDLVLGASRVIPDENLRIVDGNLICQPLPLDGSACYDYADPYRKRMRIHTKVIKDST